MSGSGGCPHSSQGSTVSWGGDIGCLLSFAFSSARAGVQDVTTMDSATVGSGDEARVVRDYESTSLDSGTASVTLLGCPPYLATECGTKNTLTIDTACGTFSAEAILESFEVEGSVGELIRGSATFLVLGAPE